MKIDIRQCSNPDKIRSLIRNILLGIIISAPGLHAQDIHFSQFDQSPLTLNPALAGNTTWMRGILHYRTQWKSVTVPYNTIGASFDMKGKRGFGFAKGKQTAKVRQSGQNGFGWGVNLYNDKAGDGEMGTLQAGLTLAYQIYINPKNMIALGMQGGMIQRSVNYGNLHWGKQYCSTCPDGYDPGAPTGETFARDNFTASDISTGLIYHFKKSERYIRGGDNSEFTIGASLFHVTQPDYSYLGTKDKLYQRMVIHGSGTIGIPQSTFGIAPSFMVARQGPNQEILAGALIRYRLKEDSKYTGFVKGATLSLGGFYRNKDAFVAAMFFEFSNYAIGASYDLNVSGLKSVSTGRGGFELTLKYFTSADFIYSQASFNK